MADWVPVLTTPAGALVGAYATYTLGRSKVSVAIDRILVQPSRFAAGEAQPVNAQLLSELRESPNVRSSYGDFVTSPERTYVTYLTLSKNSIVRGTERYGAFDAIADKLRALADSSDWPALYKTYSAQQSEFWMLAEYAEAQGRSVYTSLDPDAASDAPPAEQVYPWLEDGGDNDMMVDLPGEWALGFSYGHPNPVRQAKGRALARRASRAFAYQRRADLVTYFTAIREEARAIVKKDAALLVAVASELEKFNRLQVEFLVTNVGRSGVSIAAEAAAQIGLRDYVFTSAGTAQTVDADAVVKLRVRRADAVQAAEQAAAEAKVSTLPSDESVPILLGGGETMRLVATSDDLLRDLPAGEAMAVAYKGGERRLSLILGRFKGSPWASRQQSALGRLESGAVLFRDLRFSNLL